VTRPVPQLFFLAAITAVLMLASCGGGGSGSGTPDTTPPTVTAVDPPDNAVGVQLTDPIIVTFSETIDPASVGANSFVVRNSAGTAANGTVSASGRTARFTPAPGALVKSALYQATLTPGIRDSAGNALAADFTWNFTTTTDAWLSTAIAASTATPRADHTAIWTGNEMVVWGGADTIGVTNTGARYNPSTNTWTETETSGAPLARTGHTAVWTGSEILVWGGDLGGILGSTNTGGRYLPTAGAGSWSVAPGMNNSGLLGRRLHTAVWTGSEMIVWGGLTDAGILAGNGARYRPATDSWTNVSSSGAPSPRSGHTAVWTGTEMIVWGGNEFAPAIVGTGGRFRPATGDWRSVSIVGAPSARTGHTAIWTGTEMIVWGGNDGLPTNTGARYNPASDTWSKIADAPAALTGHTAIWTGTEMIVWGGDSSSDRGYAYRPSTNTWRATTITAAPTPRRNHTAVWTGSEMIVWGGVDTTGGITNAGGRYAP